MESAKETGLGGLTDRPSMVSPEFPREFQEGLAGIQMKDPFDAKTMEGMKSYAKYVAMVVRNATEDPLRKICGPNRSFALSLAS